MAASKSKKKTTKAKTKRGKMTRKPTGKKPQAKSQPSKQAGGDGADTRVAEIQRLIDVMVAAGAVEVEMEEKGRRLRVRLKEDPPVTVMPYAAGPAPQVAAAAGVGGELAAPATDSDSFVFNSPMVGTYYHAPSPEAEHFVTVGQEVTADTTLCILEAMKVMNEIKAETDGVIVEILAENGESIEFGQPLFVLRAV